MSLPPPHAAAFDAVDDDDDMPPLVDNPPSMMYTFAANMTPLAYNTSGGAPTPAPADPAPAADTAADAASAPRRAPAHIPRPPNAFILFRASFVRAQHVPGALAGSHSALSKIAGLCWRALPRTERAAWERRARAALAEHRARYPDWRFRPGNAHAGAAPLAKTKDGGRRARAHPRAAGSEEEQRSTARRCAKIADLLGAGVAGAELAAAVAAYDRAGGGADAAKAEDADAGAGGDGGGGGGGAVGREVARMLPAGDPDARFKVSLTALFKRSSSAPAAPGRAPLPALAIPSPFPAFLPPRAPARIAAPEDAPARAKIEELPDGADMQLLAYDYGAAPGAGVPAPRLSSYSSLNGWAGPPAPPAAAAYTAADAAADADAALALEQYARGRQLMSILDLQAPAPAPGADAAGGPAPSYAYPYAYPYAHAHAYAAPYVFPAAHDAYAWDAALGLSVPYML